ncbi:hypothetical protein K4K51_007461 [Colletotrichum sp. SAR 10_75]|nr:hypothetical protein K4K51_007461 [Colletotrichum sp. SAR 10_75]
MWSLRCHLDVLAVLEQMDAAARQEGPEVNCFNPISAWFQNTFLCEFSKAHITNTWTVPLSTDMETIVRLVIPNFNGGISKTASVQTLITEYEGLKLHLYFEKDQKGRHARDSIRLSPDAPEAHSSSAVIDGTAINLLKYSSPPYCSRSSEFALKARPYLVLAYQSFD